QTNLTFNTISNVLIKLKEFLNIDDKKVFAFGHSDGSDGAFAFEIYRPSMFAGFVAYNSMLTNIFAYDIYLKNLLNRPLYLVHSDLDNLRAIEQTKAIVNILDSMKSPVTYKEYHGYKHYDRHLQLDLPDSYRWLKKTSRDPFESSIYWETDDVSNGSCDWIRIIGLDPDLLPAPWQKVLNPRSYDKNEKKFTDEPYYYKLNKSAAVVATHNANHFNIETSRVTEL